MKQFLPDFYQQSISSTPLLTKEQEIKLSKEVLKGGAKAEKAINTLVISNVRLAIKIATKDFGWFEDSEDLISEAIIGLHKAASKYDHKFGAKFSTYAAHYIRQCILRYIEKSNLISMSSRASNMYFNLQKIITRLTEELGYEPTHEELSQHLCMPVNHIERVLNYKSTFTSIDTPRFAFDDNGSTLADVIEDENCVAPDKVGEYALEEKSINTLFEGLKPREIDILHKRFGFHQNEPMTLECIGQTLKITRERTRQLQEQALKKIRKNLKMKNTRNGNSSLQEF